MDEKARNFNPTAGGNGEFRTAPILTIATGHAVHDTYTAFLPPLLPIFITALALSKFKAGLLTVFLQIPWLLQPLIGHAADRSGLRILVVMAPAVTAAAMCMLGMASNYLSLAVLLLVAGLSSAALHAVAPAMVGKLSGQNLGRGMGIWMVGGEVGRTLGPVLVVSVVQALTLRRMPWLMIGGFIMAAILLVRLRAIPELTVTSRNSLSWRSAVKLFGPVLLPLAGIIVVRNATIAAAVVYLPTFMIEEGSGLWFAGMSLTVVEAAGVVGALLAGTVSDRIGRRRTLGLSLAGASLFMLLFLSTDGWLRLPVLMLLGVTALAGTPVVMALVQDILPDNRALGTGLYMSLSFIIRSAAVLTVGWTGDLFGLRPVYTGCAAVALLGLPLLLFLPPSEE